MVLRYYAEIPVCESCTNCFVIAHKTSDSLCKLKAVIDNRMGGNKRQNTQFLILDEKIAINSQFQL